MRDLSSSLETEIATWDLGPTVDDKTRVFDDPGRRTEGCFTPRLIPGGEDFFRKPLVGFVPVLLEGRQFLCYKGVGPYFCITTEDTSS
jgi:hypothetical protein